MNFTFISGDAKLTKPVAQDGCGLTAADLRGVSTWQREDFYFNMHTGYHGRDGNHYIYVFAGDPPARDMPRIFVEGARAGQYEGTGGGMKAKHIRDATNVVTSNIALFLKIVKNTKP